MPLEILIERNKVHPEPQTLTFPDSRIATFIGPNGCGKSAILEEVFKERVKSGQKVVCFTSGQNETFTWASSGLLDKVNNNIWKGSDDKIEMVQCFHFSLEWVRMLIFLAASLKKEGRVYNFLESNGYSFFKDGGFITLEVSVHVNSFYSKKIMEAIDQESLNPTQSSLRKSFFHDILTRLIEATLDNDYDFYEPLKKQTVEIHSHQCREIFRDNIDEIFTFLSLATSKGDTVDLKDSILSLKNYELELSFLSDGEFQLLTIYAILDLFDSEDTVFILDEIDSHLHYSNLKTVWDALRSTQGNILTSTHSLDSIILNDYGNIRVVDKGEIMPASLQVILNRLQSLGKCEYQLMRVAAKSEYIVLVENYTDWFVFTELAKKKVLSFNSEIFNKVQYIPCPSGYDSVSQDFGKEKKDWVDTFCRVHEETFSTRKIFLICDRDELPINSVHNQTLMVARSKDEQRLLRQRNTVFHLSWKRREIENYLLSPTLLANHGNLDAINELLPPAFQLNPGESNDTDNIRILNIKTHMQSLYVDAQDDTPEEDKGVNYTRLQSIIDEIPPEEISEDIVTMYNFITSKISGQ
jgi:Fe-S cluster assembly ATPase SufC